MRVSGWRLETGLEGATVALARNLGCASVALCLAGCAGEPALGRNWVHKVYIDGNKRVSDGDVKKRIATEGSSWIPVLPRKYIDHPFAVDVDKERIETYYKTRSYYSARVTSTEVTPFSGFTWGRKGAVDVHFTVDEGKSTKISEIRLSGVDPKTLQKELQLRAGDPFEHLRYEAQKVAMQQRLRQLGYAWAEVEGEVHVNRDTRTADVELTVTLGPMATFGTINVEGHKRTNPSRLVRHTGLRPGQHFTQEALDAAQGRLYDLGLFGSVKVDYTHDPQHPEVANIVFHVAESKFRELRIGGGLGLESLRTEVRLRSIYTQRNFFGGLRTLRTTAEIGYAALPAFWATPIRRHGPALQVEAQLTQPDLIGPFSELRFGLAYEVGIEYAYQFHGPRMQLGLQRSFWANRLNLAISYNIQFLDFFNTDAALLEDPARAQYLFGYQDPYRLGFFQQDISLDLRDRQLDARKGGYFGVSFQEGGVYAGGAFQFEKIMPDIRGYLPLGSRVVLAARLLYGKMFVQGDLSSPITQRYYLGGPNSHRGFNYNRLSSQVCSVRIEGAPANTARALDDCSDAAVQNTLNTGPGHFQQRGSYQVERLPIGGDEMLLMQVEARVNIFKLFGSWFSLAGFFDAGDVALPVCTQDPCRAPAYGSRLDLTNLHLAVGAGLRYQTVVGTIRLDVGGRLNRLEDERAADGSIAVQNPDPGQQIVYHISIGEAF